LEAPPFQGEKTFFLNLTLKGPRPFFAKKTLKTAISIAKSKKL